MGGGGGEYESVRMPFLEAVYGFECHFWACVFLEYEFYVMAVIVSDHSLEYVCVWKGKTLYF